MLNGAIIGFGKIARASHLEAYKAESLKDKIRITSIVEPDSVNRLKSQMEYPEMKFYQSLEELLEYDRIDFVDITCPPKYHYETIQKCIDNKLNIICEKPFTLNIQEAELVKRKLEKSDVIFIPCHQYKYSPIWKEFKKFAEESSESKKILQFNIFRTQADPGLADFSNFWRTTPPEEGGGILIDTGIHYLYLARWILGQPIKVYSNLKTLKHFDYRCEDSAFVNLETENGIAQISLTWSADKRFNDARIVCGEGSLFYESGRDLQKNIKGKKTEIPVPDASDKAHYVSLYEALITDFINAVEKKERRLDWIEDAYQSINILTNCYNSSAAEAVKSLADEQ